ncbi:hypothetical protein [Cohaesibacter sp. ES.047]|nr:hypothetical protein [Cohaesibacter sp. ES.047]
MRIARIIDVPVAAAKLQFEQKEANPLGQHTLPAGVIDQFRI